MISEDARRRGRVFSISRSRISPKLGCLTAVLLWADPVMALPGLEKLFIGESATEVAGIEVHGTTVEVHLAEGASEPGETSLITQRNQRLVTSADRTRLGRVTYRSLDQWRNTATFEFLRNRVPVWSITVDGFSDFSISDDGSTVVETLRDNHVPKVGRLRVYGSGGEVLDSESISGIRKVEISRDGNRIAVEAAEGVVILNREATRMRNLGSAFDFSLSRDGRSLALFQRGMVAVYPEEGSPFVVTTEELARDVAFTADGSSLAIVDPTFLYVVRANTGQLIFKTPVRQGAEFQDVDFSHDGTRLAFSQVEVFEKATRTTTGRARADIGTLDLKLPPSSWVMQPLGIPNWLGGTVAIDLLDNRQILVDAGARIYRFTLSNM